MVQKMLITLEIDDGALDAAQAKADKLIATLKEAEERIASVNKKLAVAEWTHIQATNLAKEKPPEGGKTCKCVEDDVADRLATVRAMLKDNLCEATRNAIDEAFSYSSQAMFKAPD